MIAFINGYIRNHLKTKALPRRGKRKNRTKSSSLLLNLAKQTKPIGEVVSAKCGALIQGYEWKTALIGFHYSALD